MTREILIPSKRKVKEIWHDVDNDVDVRRIVKPSVV